MKKKITTESEDSESELSQSILPQVDYGQLAVSDRDEKPLFIPIAVSEKVCITITDSDSEVDVKPLVKFGVGAITRCKESIVIEIQSDST